MKLLRSTYKIYLSASNFSFYPFLLLVGALLVVQVMGIHTGFAYRLGHSIPVTLPEEDTVLIDFGIQQHHVQNAYGQKRYDFYAFPIKFQYVMIPTVAAEITLPHPVHVHSIKNDRAINNSPDYFGGEIDVRMHFLFQDLEYNFKSGISIGYLFESGNLLTDPQRKTNSVYTDPNLIVVNFYPLVHRSEAFSIGWLFEKEIVPKTTLHVNANYIYELQKPIESLTNLFSLSGFILEDDNTNQTTTNNTATNTLENSTFSLFGIEKILQKLFWTTDLKDPWSDKQNDHLTLSIAIEHQIDLSYYFTSTVSLQGYIKPFVELFYLSRFSEKSLYKSHVSLNTGFLYAAIQNIQFVFSIENVLWKELSYDFYSTIRGNVILQF